MPPPPPRTGQSSTLCMQAYKSRWHQHAPAARRGERRGVPLAAAPPGEARAAACASMAAAARAAASVAACTMAMASLIIPPRRVPEGRRAVCPHKVPK